MPGLSDSPTGLNEGVGLVWLFGGLGGDGEDIVLEAPAFQKYAFQADAFQIGDLGPDQSAFQGYAFQPDAFQVGVLGSTPLAFESDAFQINAFVA